VCCCVNQAVTPTQQPYPTPIQSKSTLQSNNAANIINQSSLKCGKQIQFKNKRIATPWQKGKVQTGVGVTDLLGVVASDKSRKGSFVCLFACLFCKQLRTLTD
jgi:hypothetical protein